jgi:UTP--glucose-1-phosphate uridylyltransferase
MQPIVRKAVFPVAGLGTRFLPATKANPKEMLAVVDKPLIQYAVEEAVSAGITELIFVTSSSKRAIEDHFDNNFELEYKLSSQGKFDLLSKVQSIVPDGVTCIYVRQSQPKGLGHAIACAKDVVGDEPFAVLLADDLIVSNQRPCLQQMLSIYDDTGKSVIATQRIERSESDKYGVIDIDEPWEGIGRVQDIIEKPDPTNAPSDLGVVGRYILTPSVFSHIAELKPGAGEEIQLTDGIAELIKTEGVMALEFDGVRYDCGSKLGLLMATIALGVEHPEVGRSFRRFLQGVMNEEMLVE